MCTNTTSTSYPDKFVTEPRVIRKYSIDEFSERKLIMYADTVSTQRSFLSSNKIEMILVKLPHLFWFKWKSTFNLEEPLEYNGKMSLQSSSSASNKHEPVKKVPISTVFSCGLIYVWWNSLAFSDEAKCFRHSINCTQVVSWFAGIWSNA